MQKNNYPSIIESVKGYFADDDINYTMNDDGDTVYLKYKFSSIVVDVTVICLPTFYVIHVSYPFAYSRDNLLRNLSALNSINIGLPFGSFEFNFDCDSIRYKDGMYLAERNISKEDFGDHFNVVLYFAKKYIDQLKELMD